MFLENPQKNFQTHITSKVERGVLGWQALQKNIKKAQRGAAPFRS
jgi:hypothetical protein